MQNIFIINPKAGKGKGHTEFVEKIEKLALERPSEVGYYITKGVADARFFVDKICKETSEPIRFFACGGDGTLNEVINGAFGHSNATVGCVPIGTGNDFVRNFEDCGDFLDIKAQLMGFPKEIDLLHYYCKYGSSDIGGYAANMFNIGFDCNVVDAAVKLKKCPFISGHLAYLLGVGVILLRKKGALLKIETADECLHDGPLLLTTIANGSFCGGGIMSNPHALIDDALFDVQIVKNISRATFINLFPKYKEGTHLAEAESFILYTKADSLTITAKNKSARVSIDGELVDFDVLSIKTIPKALTFSLPSRI